jgi:uncharacterized membrane protein (DUF485 family)
MADDDLQKLVARRWRVGGLLTAVMVVAYFGFIALVAFDKETAGTLTALIVLAPILIAIYVRWANRSYDPEVEKLRGRKDPS